MFFFMIVLLYIIIIIIITTSSCYSSGHRTSTNIAIWSYFCPSSSLQLFPFSNASLWTDLLPLCLAVPLLLFPCQFQSRASCSMASFPFLTVCPIQFNFRLLIFVAPLFPLSFSKVLHLKSLPSNGCSEFFVISG